MDPDDGQLLLPDTGLLREQRRDVRVRPYAEEDDVQAGEPRRIGLLLARKGAVAVGVAAGTKLVVSKVDTHYVQGRTAAGGWSQQRFARRRDNQAKAAAADGAGIAARLLLPEVRTLEALVTGGDHTAVDTILAAAPLRPLAALRSDRFLDVPEPRRTVLEEAITQARAVRILVRDPPGSGVVREADEA